jgi:hypothetical protein
MPDIDTPLLVQAGQRIPADLDVRECWGFVIEGIKLGWLSSYKIQKLVNQLRHHEDYGIGELLFEHIDDRLRVSFLSDSAECTSAALIKELELLLAS